MVFIQQTCTSGSETTEATAESTTEEVTLSSTETTESKIFGVIDWLCMFLHSIWLAQVCALDHWFVTKLAMGFPTVKILCMCTVL